MVKRYRMYIDGQWVDGETGETFQSFNPATGQTIAELPRGTRNDAARAIAAARKGSRIISRMSVWDRSRLCLKIADVMEKRADELARTLAEEQGKPYHTEAKAEVQTAIAGFREAAELVKWLETSFIPVEDPNKRVFTIRQPRGVYAVVTPWNFPINIPVEYLAPGIASGNAIVWVPAPTTSVCAVKLMECLEEAGVPAGVVNLVTGEGPVVGDEIVSNPGTDAVGFTGSSATGRRIAERAAGKPLLLELGGNGPTIIFEDADLEAAAEAVAVGCFFNAGQTCSATEKILVHESVADAVAELLAAKAKQIKVGDPFDPQVTMGPLNNEPTAAKMDRHVQDAIDRGAKLLAGGSRLAELGSPLFYAPTVMAGVPSDSAFSMEESFGPVAPLISFRTEEEALQLADQGDLGLVSSVWTKQMGRAFRCAEAIKTGIVNINEASTYWELHIPFGGASGKRSGIGRLGGKYTLMEMTDLKTISFDISRA